MCTQDYYNYQCGCRVKGEFRQCADKHDTGCNIQCATTEANELQSRSYCANHLLKEGKGKVMYSTSMTGGKSDSA